MRSYSTLRYVLDIYGSFSPPTRVGRAVHAFFKVAGGKRQFSLSLKQAYFDLHGCYVVISYESSEANKGCRLGNWRFLVKRLAIIMLFNSVSARAKSSLTTR